MLRGKESGKGIGVANSDYRRKAIGIGGYKIQQSELQTQTIGGKESGKGIGVANSDYREERNGESEFQTLTIGLERNRVKESGCKLRLSGYEHQQSELQTPTIGLQN